MPSFIYIHIGLVRLRVIGGGNLDMEAFGYNDIESKTFLPIALASTRKNQRDRLTTFVSQGSKIKVSMNEIDEWFSINDMTVFIRPQWQSGPLVD